jgi:putative ABC transport system permease protein
LLAVMAIVIALVGGVGLSGILSLSVLERRREIGVMRAIGASSWQVTRLFVGEGVLLGLISWLIALPLSIPIAYGFTTQGLSFALNQQLAYQFTPAGAALWLVIITMLAIVASALPARGAARISVRESLSYS